MARFRSSRWRRRHRKIFDDDSDNDSDDEEDDDDSGDDEEEDDEEDENDDEDIMAILTVKELAKLRQGVAKSQSVVNYNKANINSGLQAIEDWFNNNRSTVSDLIDTATSPFIFTNSQKRALSKFWLRQKFDRETL